MNRATRTPAAVRGFSIVELMVALAISLFLMAGAISLLVTSKKTYTVNDDLSRIQESGRIAMEYMSHDLRMAGYFGCADNIEVVYNHVNGATGGALLDTSLAVEGYDGDAPTASRKWLPSGSTDTANIRAGQDGITVRYLEPGNISVTSAMPQASSNIFISTPNDLTKGEIIAVTDCSSADIFQISGPNGTGPSHVVHNTGTATSPGNHNNLFPGCPGSAVNCLSKVYDTNARIMRLVAYRYYVGNGDADGDGDVDADDGDFPVLYRQGLSLDSTSSTLSTSAVQLIDGVEYLSITYGVDTTGDRIPDVYIRSFENSGGIDLTTSNGWNNVISVRIGLLVRSTEEQAPETDDRDYNVNGLLVCEQGDTSSACGAFHPVDRRRRRVFTSTILMRNER